MVSYWVSRFPRFPHYFFSCFYFIVWPARDAISRGPSATAQIFSYFFSGGATTTIFPCHVTATTSPKLAHLWTSHHWISKAYDFNSHMASSSPHSTCNAVIVFQHAMLVAGFSKLMAIDWRFLKRFSGSDSQTVNPAAGWRCSLERGESSDCIREVWVHVKSDYLWNQAWNIPGPTLACRGSAISCLAVASILWHQHVSMFLLSTFDIKRAVAQPERTLTLSNHSSLWLILWLTRTLCFLHHTSSNTHSAIILGVPGFPGFKNSASADSASWAAQAVNCQRWVSLDACSNGHLLGYIHGWRVYIDGCSERRARRLMRWDRHGRCWRHPVRPGDPQSSLQLIHSKFANYIYNLLPLSYTSWLRLVTLITRICGRIC